MICQSDMQFAVHCTHVCNAVLLHAGRTALKHWMTLFATFLRTVLRVDKTTQLHQYQRPLLILQGSTKASCFLFVGLQISQQFIPLSHKLFTNIWFRTEFITGTYDVLPLPLSASDSDAENNLSVSSSNATHALDFEEMPLPLLPRTMDPPRAIDPLLSFFSPLFASYDTTGPTAALYSFSD